ncbi:expressed unknown protein [Seminavis robusta]|uniref:Uncharacterized protein n=1 Tax=Seminavis robusta TaxID=568900 RepID=A0A9N8F0P9_9STRA|nr:expressed unknown protein [Seminavis robusta]|eukprot:Sro2999_g341900.1 n/a (196) ;mRNA; f:4957-5544
MNSSFDSILLSHDMKDDLSCGYVGDQCLCGCWEDAMATNRYARAMSKKSTGSSAFQNELRKSDSDDSSTCSTGTTMDDDESIADMFLDDVDEDSSDSGEKTKCYKISVFNKGEPQQGESNHDDTVLRFKIAVEGSRGMYLSDIDVLVQHVQELIMDDQNVQFEAHFLDSSLVVSGNAEDVLRVIKDCDAQASSIQ